MRIFSVLLLLLCCIAVSDCTRHQDNASEERPNIVVIMSDDMGYSDIGAYGGEINTPNLDALARNGLKYTQFYNQARCAPTRASLMTGLYPHQSGMGWMAARDHELPGYQGKLSANSITMARVLKQAGYNTYMTGKWHLAHDKLGKRTKKNWPLQRGFDKYYGTIKGAANYFDPGTLVRGNEMISPFADSLYQPEEYYLTDAISDNLVQYIADNPKDEPFFMYVSYTAAHWPIQAPAEEIEKYKGKYDQGWEAIRKERLQRMKKLGVIDADAKLASLATHSWEDEDNKKAMARRMETYAAMVDIMDQGIGRIVDELKRKGIYDNTVILYLQDNGGSADRVGRGKVRPVARDTSGLTPLKKDEIETSNNPPITRDGRIVMQGNKVMAGLADTYVGYLKPWARASNTPFTGNKPLVYEGGISTPLIVHWPDGIQQEGEIRDQLSNVIDIMPTVVDLADAKYPKEFGGNSIKPQAGVSLVPTFENNEPLDREAIFWSHRMNRAVRMGKWKLVSPGRLYNGGYGRWKYYENEPWELYSISNDRSEIHDVSGEHPDLVQTMIAKWQDWADRVNVYPTPWAKETDN